jgi:hypothetical protein
MERPTKEITLPASKARIVLYTYFTIGDRRKISRATLSGMQMTLDPSNPQTNQTISGESIIDAEEIAFSCIIKEAWSNGEKVENLAEFIENLPDADGIILKDQVNELDKASGLSADQKKK